MTKYKFAIDPEKIPEIEIFLKKNSHLFSSPPEIKQNANISAHLKFFTENEDSLFKLHKFLLKTHQIESILTKKEIKEPIIAVTLNWCTGNKAYFNYVLSYFFIKQLIDNSIDFSIGKIAERYFHLFECVPVWITKKDFKRVKKMINNSPLRTRGLIDIIVHIIPGS